MGCQRKQCWWWAVGVRWASCQCPDSRNLVGCRRSTSEATTNPLTTTAAASRPSVDSQTISGGPPLTRHLMYMVVDDGAKLLAAGRALSKMAVASELTLTSVLPIQDLDLERLIFFLRQTGIRSTRTQQNLALIN